MNTALIAEYLGLGGGVEPSSELIRACSFLELDPKEVILKARFYFTVSLITSFALSLMFTRIINSLLISLITGFGLFYYTTEQPKWRAKEERLRALGQAPELITTLSASLELNPNLEQAISLVCESINGRLGRDLSLTYRDTMFNGESINDSFEGFINDWGTHSIAFKQGLELITAGLTSEEYRRDMINEGMNTFFKGLLNEFKTFLSKVKIHSLVLFSFGTILPLIITSLLPVMGLLNASINQYFISGLLLINLVGVHYYSDYITKTRPPTFSQVVIKDFKKPILYSTLLFFVISSPSILYFTAKMIGGFFPIPVYYASMPLIIGLSVGLSVYYHKQSKPLLEFRRKALEVEGELLNITYALGSELRGKRSFEEALKQVILKNTNALTQYLKNAYLKVRDLGTAVKKSVIKELEKSESNRAVSIFNLVFTALKKGVDNSAACVFRVYDYFNQVRLAEEEHNSMIAQLTGMMSLTVLFFAPLINAFIVILQDVINTNLTGVDFMGLGLNSSLGVDYLMLLLGLYNLGLVVVLTRFQARLTHGPDKVWLKHSLSRNIVISTMVFISSLIGYHLFF